MKTLEQLGISPTPWNIAEKGVADGMKIEKLPEGLRKWMEV